MSADVHNPETSATLADSDREAQALIAAVVGGAILFIGTFLPFLTASAGDFSGSTTSQSWNLWTDNSGIIITCLAIASIVLAKARMYVGLFVASVLAAIDILYERSTIISAKNSLLGALVHLDIGIAFWVLLVGCGIIIIAGVVGIRARQS